MGLLTKCPMEGCSSSVKEKKEKKEKKMLCSLPSVYTEILQAELTLTDSLLPGAEKTHTHTLLRFSWVNHPG